MVVSTLRVFSLQGTSRAYVLAFVVGAILLGLGGSSIYDRTKKRKAGEVTALVYEDPDFAVPLIPMSVSTFVVPSAVASKESASE